MLLKYVSKSKLNTKNRLI